MQRQRLSRWTEVILWIIAVTCFGLIAWTGMAASQARHDATMIAEGTAPAKAGPEATSASTVGLTGEVIGQVRIRALGLSVPMTVGTESSSLLRGVGHVTGTALPGGLGTIGLAGHRDTYLRPLERVARGMDIEVMDASGTYHYVVDSSEIVLPEQVDVLSIRSRPELALITCYPFHFIGAAPKRFVVHAHLASLSPDAAPARVPEMHGKH